MIFFRRFISVFAFCVPAFLDCAAQDGAVKYPPGLMHDLHVQEVSEVQYTFSPAGGQLPPWTKNTIDFDTSGRIVKVQRFDPMKSTAISSEIYHYGPGGKISRVDFYSYGMPENSCFENYIYDTTGRLVLRRDSSMQSGKITGFAVFTYDSSGLVQTKDYYLKKKKLQDRFIYTSDSAGRLVKDVSYYYLESDKPIDMHVYFYEDGRLTGEDVYLHDMKVSCNRVGYVYDGNGKLTSYNFFDGKGKLLSRTDIVYTYYR
ncbi:MAG TPA: hypothetical protein VFU15_12865 [Bacteroidia bacterium]|nr:hypothetical protein [Bacteroidia bacterium]